MKKAILLIVVGMLIGAGSCMPGLTTESYMDRVKRESNEILQWQRDIENKNKLKLVAKRNEFFEKHPELDENIKQIIEKDSFVLGMTDEQVIASIGYPHKRNISIGSWGKHEQWICGTYNFILKRLTNKKYLYFENGILTSWQN